MPKHSHTTATDINTKISLLKKRATDNVNIIISVLNENNAGLENIYPTPEIKDFLLNDSITISSNTGTSKY